MTMTMRGSLLLACVSLLMATTPLGHAAHASSEAVEKTSLTITDRQGHTHLWTVELARTPAELEKGESGRSVVAEGTGMLFLFTPARAPVMWMRETAMPLDMVFIDADGRITDIAEKTVPFSEASITGQGDSRAVLEVQGGAMEKNGIVVGDKVTSSALSAAPVNAVSIKSVR